MDFWTELLKQAGVWAVVLASVGWFFARRVWPFLTEQVNKAAERAEALQKDSIERVSNMQEKFVDALRRRDEGYQNMSREMSDSFRTFGDKVVEKLDRIDGKLEKTAGKKKGKAGAA